MYKRQEIAEGTGTLAEEYACEGTHAPLWLQADRLGGAARQVSSRLWEAFPCDGEALRLEVSGEGKDWTLGLAAE